MQLTDEERLSEEVGYWFDALDKNQPQHVPIRGMGGKPIITPWRFKRIVPLITSIVGDDWFVFGDASPTDIDWPIDICYLAPQPSDNWCKWQIQRFQATYPDEVRGKVKRVCKYMMRRSVWFAPRDASDHPAATETVLVYLMGRWVEAGTGQNWSITGERGSIDGYSPAAETQTEENALGGSAACGLAFNRRYEWGVEISIAENAPSIFLPSDPTGLRAMFAHRSRNPLTNRRDALLHWVREHFRRKRHDQQDAAWVRRYLRGKWAFDWYGMRAVIHPSQFDIEQALTLRPPPALPTELACVPWRKKVTDDDM